MNKLVMFVQPNCVPCRQLKPIVEQHAKDLNIPLEYWDVSEDWDLAVQYNVKSTPMLFQMDRSNVALTTVSQRTSVLLKRELKELFSE